MPGTGTVSTDLMSFLDASVTSSHAISRSASILDGMGYTCRSEAGRWPSESTEPFYVIRGTGSLIAVLPGRLPPWESGFRIAGAHTDYPGFRLKPHPVRRVEGGTVLGVEIYGSPNIPTWFDRDLMLAGTAWFRTGEQGVLQPALFSLDRPLCRISMPAVHLQRGINEEGFTFNKEDNLCPYLGSVEFRIEDLEGMIAGASGHPGEVPSGYTASLADCQKAAVGGPGGEMFFSGRIDNLAMCHAAIAALRIAGAPDSTAVVCLFDHEEIGSSTSSGAASRLLDEILERLCLTAGREGLFMAGHRSMLVSADAAHALNPCYAGKYDKIDRPVLNAGPVVKLNAQQRYSTSASSSAYFRGCADAAGVGVQTFAGRNDIPCGSTIGPIISTRLGVQSVDVGNPILSMHSIREAAGISDHSMMISALGAHLGGVVPLPAQV